VERCTIVETSKLVWGLRNREILAKMHRRIHFTNHVSALAFNMGVSKTKTHSKVPCSVVALALGPV
jgi:hypothetical protein